MTVTEEISLAKRKFEKQGIDWHKTTLVMSKKTAEQFLSEITEMKVEIVEEDGAG